MAYTLEIIKKTVDAGFKVYVGNTDTRVIKDNLGKYLIGYDIGGDHEHFVGLTHKDGATMNLDLSKCFGAIVR